MLTIGELARLAGSTVRAVRHYHGIGLLPEPARDGSGYRRYGATALVRLLRVRRLRELGLPLDGIAALLDGPEPDLHDALDALDAELAAQAERIADQRARLAAVRASNPDPELPEPLATIFAKALAEGAPARAIALEKEAVLLDLALHPEAADVIIAEYRQMYDRLTNRPGYADLARRFDELADVDADTATVQAMAAELAELIRTEHAAGGGSRRGATHPLAELLMSDWGERMAPSQRRVMERTVQLVADLW